MNNLITGFDHPAFFYAYATLLLLLILYWFHRRSTVKRVSAIFLWDKPETSPESGSRRVFRRLPLSFYLEALALALLVLAAAAPFRMGMETYPPLAVVLDNSFSMRAEPADGGSPRVKGEAELLKRFDAHPGRRIVLILAGGNVQLLSDSRTKPKLDGWTGDEPVGDLAGALALARSRAPGAEFLLVTDRKPEFPLADDVGVFAPGTSLGNTALVNVRRNAETILAEALNASHLDRAVVLKLTPGGTVAETTLAPGERRKFVWRLPEALRDRPVMVTLETAADALEFDNVVTILPEDHTPVGYRLAEHSDEQSAAFGRVLTGNPDYRRSSTPELVIGNGIPPGSYHRLVWNPGDPERVKPSAEPLAIRAGHPLTRGLGNEGVRWNADPEVGIPGDILIRRDDVTLLSHRRRMDGFYDIFLNLAPRYSNVPQTTLWPSLFWNIADLLRADRPGPGKRNRRSGEVVEVKLPEGIKELKVECADGKTRTATPLRRTVLLANLPPGVNRITAGESVWEVSILPLSATESDLESCAPFYRKATDVKGMADAPRLPLGWLALILAALVLAFHQTLFGMKKRGRV